MNKITVKLSPKDRQFKRHKVVFGAIAALETMGVDKSKIATTAKDSTVDFFEKSDPSAAIFTLTSTITEVNGKPEFDIDAASVTRGNTSGAADTDFSISLAFGAGFKNNANTTFIIRIPFDCLKGLSIVANGATGWTAKAQSIRLAGRVTIGGAVEAPAFRSSADELDIPVLHKDVLDADTQPGAANPLTNDNVGIGAVYPLGIFSTSDVPVPTPLLTPTQTIPKGTLDVALHASLATDLNALASGSFDATALNANLSTIFAGVFANVAVRNATPTEERAWTRFQGQLFANNIPNPPNVPPGAVGNLLPFFQFQVDASTSLPSAGKDLAHGETLSDARSRLVLAPAQKRVVTPISIPSSRTQNFGRAYRAMTSDAERMLFLANVLAHEIGHGLGLLHAQVFNGTSYTGGLGVGLMHTDHPDAPPITLAKLGPVHEALLRKHYR